MDDGRWTGRYWSPDGHINLPCEGWAADAFQIEIDKEMVSTGWKVVSASERPKTDRGARHFVVALSNGSRSVGVEVHTVVDGTPVLVRWLEITNASDKPMALGSCFPWSGRLCVGQEFSLGYYTKDAHSFEGWFDWKPLTGGEVVIRGLLRPVRAARLGLGRRGQAAGDLYRHRPAAGAV